MPDEPLTPPPYDPARRVGTGLAGETTRSEGSTIRREANQSPLEMIGDFEVLGKLGQGGMGAVYRARQVSLDRQVALKILPPNFEADPEYVSRFQREARVAASLSHANLVKVYASGVADGCHYIAMELIEGETLGQWIKRGPLPPLEALRITLDVARALECGWHTAQLIHRDIKPGNIFLSVDGEVKLGDLGLAKIIGGDTTGLTQTGMMMGTPHYISPEQARGDRDLDFRADIYSLGCTLYQMLTRQTPYGGSEPMVVMNQHINAPPPAILKVMPQCPLPLARLVSKMMKKQRRERHTNYEELIAAIESVRAQLDPTLAAQTMPPTLRTARPPAGDVAGQASPLPGKPSPAVAAGATALPPAAPKPKLGRWLGIAASAVVLGLVAWFARPREEKLTAAQRWAHEHAGEQSARIPSPAAAPIPSETHVAAHAAEPTGSVQPEAGYPQPRAWIDGTEEVRRWGLKSGGLVVEGDWLAVAEGKKIHYTDGLGHRRFTNLAIRVVFSNQIEVFLRQSSKSYYGGVRTHATIGMYDPAIGTHGIIAPVELGSTYVADAQHELIFAAQGDQLSLWLDGRKVASARDATVLAGPAQLVFHSGARIKKVEYGELPDLDASGGAGQPPPATYPQPPTWIDATAAFRSENLANGKLVAEGDWLKVPVSKTFSVAGGLSFRNPILRVLFSEDVYLGVRRMSKDGQDQRYSAHIGQSYANITLTAATNLRLDGRKLEAPDRLGGEHEAVFAAQGDRLTLWLDGKVVATAQDSTLTAGSIAVALDKGGPQGDGRMKKVEYGELPDTAAARLSPSAELWQDMLHDPAKLGHSGGAERTPEGLRFTDAGGAYCHPSPKHDGAVRMRATVGGLHPKLLARDTHSIGLYQLGIYAKVIQLARWDNRPRQNTILREFPLREPLQPGQEYELELRVVGQTLTAKLNGEVLGTVTDGTLTEGEFGVGVTDHNGDPVLVKALEVLDLDAPGGASATPAATKEKPL